MRPFKSIVSALVLTAFLYLSLIQSATAQPAQPYNILWQRQIAGGSGSADQPPVISYLTIGGQFYFTIYIWILLPHCRLIKPPCPQP
ncbi:MAG: hypothetical protein PWR22_1214 [Moorella sp. (in: firmicutes)]|nr:hypothetical protein [Moorella sp. (in: firmicutes)]